MKEKEVYDLLGQIDEKVKALQGDITFLFQALLQMGMHMDTSLQHHVATLENMENMLRHAETGEKRTGDQTRHGLDAIKQAWGVGVTCATNTDPRG